MATMVYLDTFLVFEPSEWLTRGHFKKNSRQKNIEIDSGYVEIWNCFCGKKYKNRWNGGNQENVTRQMIQVSRILNYVGSWNWC